MRVMSLAVVVPVMIVWTVLCIRQNQFIIPDTRIVTLLATAIGGKAVQSFSENFSGAGGTPSLPVVDMAVRATGPQPQTQTQTTEKT